jgi:prophage DNA circulation protein
MARLVSFAPASFDGLPFYVDAQELEEGRRVLTQEYPGAEDHDNEDLGLNATRFEITAYFASDNADNDAQALRARLRIEGPGLLTLPMFGAVQARAVRWRPGWQQQRLNYVGFQVVFVEESDTSPSSPIGLGEAILANMASSLGSVLGGAIGAALVGEPLTGYARSDVAAQLVTFGASIETVRQATALPDKTSSKTALAIADAVSSIAGGPSVAPDLVTAQLVDALDAIAIDALDPAAASATMQTAMAASLVAYNSSLATVGVSPKVSIVPLTSAMAFAAEASRLLAIAPYKSRPDAVAARSTCAGIAATITPICSGAGLDAVDAFDAIYGKSARHLSDQIASLAPVVLVELGASLPANVLANRLYGDPSRSQELIDRNQVATPCFMPRRFEALSS